MKQLEFQIMDQAYLLGCPEGGEDKLTQAVLKVDTAMQSIRDRGKLRSRDRIAVLAALNLAFDQLHMAEEHQRAVAQAASPVDEAQLKSLLKRMDQALDDSHLSKPKKRI